MEGGHRWNQLRPLRPASGQARTASVEGNLYLPSAPCGVGLVGGAIPEAVLPTTASVFAYSCAHWAEMSAIAGGNTGI